MVNGDMASRIAHVVREPTNSKLIVLGTQQMTNLSTDDVFGRFIIHDVIPAIEFLRKLFPFKIPTCYSLSAQQIYDVGPVLDCRDLLATDALLDSIPYESVFCCSCAFQ